MHIYTVCGLGLNAILNSYAGGFRHSKGTKFRVAELIADFVRGCSLCFIIYLGETFWCLKLVFVSSI